MSGEQHRYEWSKTGPTIRYVRVMPGANREARRRKATQARWAARIRKFVLSQSHPFGGEFYVGQRAIVALQRRLQLRSPALALRIIERDPVLNAARERYTALRAAAA